jgi:sulfotransferase
VTLEQKKNKKLFFLIAQPRSGNTLLASILNQNPDIACTGNSITLEIMKKLYLLKEDETFKNFPDHNSLDNVLSSVYDSYYKDWPQRIIIDRGPVLTEGNMMLMPKYFKHSYKCIVLLRDLMDVLASYIKWYTENVDAFINKLGNTDEEKLTLLMSKDGAIGKNLTAMQNSLNYQHLCCYIKYDDLVTNPKPEIKKIYQLIDEPYYPHKFENLQQLNINDIGYDDTVLGKNMHTIRSKIQKIPNPYKDRIPQSIRDKYEHIRF